MWYRLPRKCLKNNIKYWEFSWLQTPKWSVDALIVPVDVGRESRRGIGISTALHCGWYQIFWEIHLFSEFLLCMFMAEEGTPIRLQCWQEVAMKNMRTTWERLLLIMMIKICTKERLWFSSVVKLGGVIQRLGFKSYEHFLFYLTFHWK